MKVIGWCTECRKAKHVRVSGPGMVTLARSGLATGVCSECEEKAERERRKRRGGGR